MLDTWRDNTKLVETDINLVLVAVVEYFSELMNDVCEKAIFW